MTQWPDRDVAWLEVTQEVSEVIENRQQRQLEELHSDAPEYPDAEIRDRSRALEEAYERRAELETWGESTLELDKTIAVLKRRM